MNPSSSTLPPREGPAYYYQVPLIAFECRGCEITKWHPERGYTAVSEGGTVFDDVDLSDDWCEYDADNDAAVGVYDLEWKLERQ
ncbi:hypothetical protein FOZ62_019865 [Perkinsus olseni]|uniref:Uncharacterized protein n=1 Tax=Perkinsus olseni TaxID=32597 RepID=A0A7J6QEX5_PEROL|nr:hypothetical protein FOZ62_019865 [Perkinsus olseni]